jgi:death-on-curing protein
MCLRSTIGFWRSTAAQPACVIGAFWSQPLRVPAQHHAYAGTSDIVEMAALYTAGIVRNHLFVDGNKRTGFVMGVLFLELHGFDFKASEVDATQAVMALASGTLDEAAFTEWLRENAKRKRGR